ncbi:ScbA/BarX family gamma-butyrolactone biosynthesis protein [Kitasatospora sp. NPDC048540]|uniref:ScbA/BarX family gamma-butyrolactone biosynthesis protein n=1 Tax=unclassified Kitasatospora TaxID=2633591 RepID=UPI0006894EF0|nr:ScbA/BarX family gamma-butyrolactone biosynthesis protein [Kitasatospora sp. MBT63]
MTVTETDQLSFSRTVNRTLVHRDSIGEVFLTDLRSTGEDTYAVAAMLPRSHAYYGDHLLRPGRYDPVLLLEAGRQACLAGAHAFYEVPLTDKFILTFLRISLIRPQLLVVGSRPLRVTMKATVTDRRLREGRITGLDTSIELSVDGTVIGWTGVGLRFRDPSAYADLRAKNRDGRPLPSTAELPVAPARSLTDPYLVGRAAAANVILSDAVSGDGVARAALHVPPEHPSLFDHAQDHLPGMVLTEAARQVAVFAAMEARGLSPAKVYPTELFVTMTRFGELEPATVLTAKVCEPQTGAQEQPGTFYTQGGPLHLPEPDEPALRVPVTVTATQDGAELATFAITLATVTQ